MRMRFVFAGILGIFLLGVLLMSEGITGMVVSESCCLGQDCPASACESSQPANYGPAVESPDEVRFYIGVILICLVVIVLCLSSLGMLKLKWG